MIRITTLPLVLLIATASQAQVSIGANEMPHAGDELYRTRAFTNPFLDYATTGANHTWDFSNLSANTQESTAYQTVASTNFVYAIAYADIFFNPNRANVARPGVDIAFSGLLPIDNPFTFTYRSSSTYETVGFGAGLAGIPVPIIFTDHDVIYELPVNYGDVSNSSSSWNVSLPTLLYYGYQQERTNEVDGWGTIATPAGTFDVLRVKTTLVGQDTIALDSLSLGFTIDRPVVREYKWLAQNHRVPILQVNTSEIFGLEVITDIWFYDEPHTIVVVPPIAALCPGSTIEVNYEATGTFNPGTFLIPANVFTAQLSDATGDFTNAVNIGSVTSTVSGTILATIPPGTPLGTGYRIRVVSNSPAFVGNDNGIDLEVGGAPVALASAGGSTEFCSGGSVLLTGTGGGTYQWQLDGADIAGATSASLSVDAAGAYNVVATTGCGTGTSNVIDVVVNELPLFTLSDDSVQTCDGTPVMIAGIDLSGQSPLAYQWYLDGVALAGEVGSEINAGAAGDYTLEVTNGGTSCAFTTNATNLAVETVVAPVITALDTTAFCEGGSVMLDASSEAGLDYQWTQDGLDLSGETDTLLLVIASGSYAVEVNSVNGCTATSAAVDVTVNPLPTTPVITQSGDSLFASGSGPFQWYVDGSLIPGATDAFLVPDSSGDYTVQVSDGDCSSSSDPYTYISTGVAIYTPLDMQVIPNPSNGSFWIAASGVTGQTFEINDATGKLVLAGTITRSHTEVDLSDRDAGIYFLRVLNDGSAHAIRIVVAR